MKHSLSLTLRTRKIEGIVTCEDHAECPANAMIKADVEEVGRYSEYPTFLEWYAGPLTPVRSDEIHLELFDRFVKWSYVNEVDSTEASVLDDSKSGLFYAPVMKADWGIVHNLNSVNSKETVRDIESLEESLIGFISTYVGAETDYRPGYITLIETNDRYFGESDISWTYSE